MFTARQESMTAAAAAALAVAAAAAAADRCPALALDWAMLGFLAGCLPSSSAQAHSWMESPGRHSQRIGQTPERQLSCVSVGRKQAAHHDALHDSARLKVGSGNEEQSQPGHT